MKKIAIVGAGFSGATIARVLAENSQLLIHVIDGRNHIAGNCHTERDQKSGVMVHKYGAHIFHTSNPEVWGFVNRFSEFGPYTNRVKAITERGVYSLPVNLLTINQFFKKNFSPAEAEKYVSSIADKSIQEPKSFEEQALKFLGRELYENFFRGYTLKQWGIDPKLLPASILKRLPVRFNYDDNYFNDRYQGIPVDGYTGLISKMLDHERVQVQLNRKFEPNDAGEFDHVFYCGTIDGFFGYQYGKLRYRTLDFEVFWHQGDFQGNAVINYCSQKVPYTRIVEHKHFAPWEQHEQSICFREFSREMEKEGDIPFYPLHLAEDNEVLQKYLQLSKSNLKIQFIGRLGTYRYLDMHIVVAEALQTAKTFLNAIKLV